MQLHYYTVEQSIYTSNLEKRSGRDSEVEGRGGGQSAPIFSSTSKCPFLSRKSLPFYAGKVHSGTSDNTQNLIKCSFFPDKFSLKYEKCALLKLNVFSSLLILYHGIVYSTAQPLIRDGYRLHLHFAWKLGPKLGPIITQIMKVFEEQSYLAVDITLIFFQTSMGNNENSQIIFRYYQNLNFSLNG